MSLAAAATLAGRRAAESLMVDSCTIEHRSGAGVLDEATGQVSKPATVVYTGPCRVQVPQAQPRTAEVAERTATLQGIVVSIPVGSGGVRVGAVVRITAATLDPELVDRTFRVVGIHHKTHGTAQRLQCEEVTA